MNEENKTMKKRDIRIIKKVLEEAIDYSIPCENIEGYEDVHILTETYERFCSAYSQNPEQEGLKKNE